MGIEIWLQQKLFNPIVKILQQGTTPIMLSWSITIGFFFGLFPVIGSTTIICFAISVIFRLNIAIIQIINYLMYPIQLFAIVPFIVLGRNILSIDKSKPINLIYNISFESLNESLPIIYEIVISAIVGWITICTPLSAIIFGISFTLLNRKNKKDQAKAKNF